MQDENKNKGGRIAKKNSEYYGKQSLRDSNTRLAKLEFGSLAVDCIQAATERIAQSDFFLFALSKVNLRRIATEDNIPSEDFIKVIEYCVIELEMFDSVLFANGFLFSVEFVRNFERAGLFRHRKYGIGHILNSANFYRAGHPPLTAEDQLEIIACGGGTTNLNSLKGSTNSINENVGTGIILNPSVIKDMTEDDELPF